MRKDGEWNNKCVKRVFLWLGGGEGIRIEATCERGTKSECLYFNKPVANIIYDINSVIAIG